MIRTRRFGRLVAPVLLAMAVAAGCGSSGSADPAPAPAGPAAPSFVQADVDFVVQLSQHHGQALHLAELALARGRSAEVRSLAARITESYAPQVDILAGWIRAWAAAGAELPAHEVGHGEDAPGMLPERAVTRLESLRGPAFDREFRALMDRHHRARLKLVNALLQNGVNPDARALAEALLAEEAPERPLPAA